MNKVIYLALIFFSNIYICFSQIDFNILIERHKIENDLVYGKISVNDIEIGNCYENNDLKIKAGDYKGVMRYFSPKGFAQNPFGNLGKEGDFLLEVSNVQSRTNILFHTGNKPEHSTGCILLGPVNKTIDGSRYVNEDHPLYKLRILFYGTNTPISSPDKQINITIADISTTGIIRICQNDNNCGNFTGVINDGKANGKGILKYDTGDVYEGIFKDNKRNGQGIKTWTDGSNYNGNWKEDKKNGKGTFSTVNGDKYIGDWSDDDINGQGTFSFANGDIYSGNWKNNTMHGQGTFTSNNGDTYIGQWVNNTKNGQGSLTTTKGDKYVGEFKNDEINGFGTFYFVGGEIYIGEYKNGSKNGKGTYTDSNGSKFIGEFINNNRYNGIEYYSDGSYNRTWKDGIPTK